MNAMAGRKKRGPGEGSIFQRKDGRWVAELVLGYGPDGKRIVKRAYGRTRAEVSQWLAKVVADRHRGMPLEKPDRATVAQFLDRWLEDVVRHSCRPSTYASYRQYVRNHIAPVLGGLRIQKLTPARIQAFYAQKLDEGLSPRTVQYLHAILHRALEQAVKWELLARNPCAQVERPRVARQERPVLTPEQVQAFLEAARHDRFYALYVLAVATGLRQGELLGLTWDDVDFEARRLYVRRQLVWPRGEAEEPYLAEPKSARGLRVIDLPESVVRVLEQHRWRQTEEKLKMADAWAGRFNLVFTTHVGTPVSPGNLLRRSFWPLLEKAGLPRIRFHDLRHTCGTLLAAQGVHPKLIQDILGHSSITVTMDIYGHVLPTMRRQVADLMDRLVGPALGDAES